MKVRYSYLKQQFSNCDDLWRDLKKFVSTGDFTLGKPLLKFEKSFAKLIGTKYAVGVNSGTDALFLILKSLKIPPIGGDTVFSNMELALETLDEDIKKIIQNKRAIHTSNGSKFFVENYSKMESNGKIGEQYSNEHPIIRTHPETGKKILYVNPTYTKKIVGLPDDESSDLLNNIFKHQERLDLSCRFKWTENAVAILDNRSTQHYAIADFYPGRGLGHERVMDRISIVGDKPF